MTDATITDADLARIEQSTQEIGRAIFDRLGDRQPSVFQKRWWDDRIMAWAMQDEAVKVQMFRFIDVLPMLTTRPSVLEHLHEYLGAVRERLPAALRMGMALATPRSIAGRAVAAAARRNALAQARRFIAGTTSDEVAVSVMRERQQRRAFTLDILGEAVTSESEADRYLQRYLELLEGLAPAVNSWPEVPEIDRALFAEIPRVNLSVKLSALDSQFDPVDPEGTAHRVGVRLRELLRAARRQRAHIHVDMESYKTKTLTLAIFMQVLMDDEFRDMEDVGIVIQCYLKDAEEDLRVLAEWAARRGTPVTIRLVKGAYWDYEVIHARSTGWPVPVFEKKWQTDANFERATRLVMTQWRHLRPALGSHNVRSLAHGIAAARHLGVPQTAVELQMLYGMADAEKQALVDMGYRMRIYMPFGELIPGMSYLVRRLLENTSNDSFLRASFSEDIPVETLLMKPGEQQSEPKAAAPRTAVPASPQASNSGGGATVFRNEPPTDFAIDKNRSAMRAALADVRARSGKDNYYPLVIGGNERRTDGRIESPNPSHRRETVGVTAEATAADAVDAVAAARAAFADWSAMEAAERAGYLRDAAAAMRARRFELAAWEVLECGKGWREADADVAEAIDFCEYYAAGAIDLARPARVNMPGEENRLEYVPRGVCAVIAPWNFPLAILTGMTAAALATGNTVVFKPAEQSSIVGAKLFEVLREAGLPDGVANYLPGSGEVAGAALVDHPDVALIAFTGSRSVGLAINARAAQMPARGRVGVKHVIAEMGGKNAIIVDDDADLDDAVLGILHSAFGYQGQKCSACSRAIVLDGVYDSLIERLVEAARSLKVGPAEDPATSVGPLIDAESVARVARYAALGRQTAREVLAVGPGPLAEEGFYVGPHIYADVDPRSKLAQEEIFGPVLAVIRAADLDEAFAIFNDSEYALTGGIFSRRPAHLERARRELLVGNLYLNRGITGALVGRQPFGGFKFSGIGTKAGGPDYLLQFVLPRTITENTVRRGFAPLPENDEGEKPAGI